MFGLGDLHAAMVDGGMGVYGCEVRGDVEDALGELPRLTRSYLLRVEGGAPQALRVAPTPHP